MKITKKEWTYVTLVAIIAVLLINIPLIVGKLTEGPNEVFTGIPVHVTDANSHLHLILQVKEGAILTTNKFTQEEVPALLFNPYHLVLGWTAFVFDADVVAIYNIFNIIFALGFFFILYYFISEFIKDKTTRLIALVISAFASGLAFWWSIVINITGYNFGSAEMWVTDMNVFTSLGIPHFVLSMSLLLLVFLFAYRSFEKKDIKNAVYAGLIGLLLTLIHIFDTVTFAVILTAYFVVRQIKKKWNWKEFRSLAIIGAITLPGVIYYAWVFVFNPAYSEWNSLNQVLTPRLVGMISGFGIALFLSLVYIYLKRKQIFSKKLIVADFLVVWLVANFILIYIPSNVQVRFSLGMFIPMCMLSAFVINENVVPYIKKNWLRTATVTLIILIMSATTFYIISVRLNNLHLNESSEYGNVKYLSKAEYETLEWIDDNIPNDAIIFAPHHISNYIPAITGNKIYSGHWAQTIDFSKKYALVNKAYNEGLFPEFFGVDYVIWYEEINEKEIIYYNQGIYIYEASGY